MPSRRDFATEIAALESSNVHGPEVVYSLRDLHEAWARSLLGLSSRANLVTGARSWVEAGLDAASASRAAVLLEVAEKHQWQIASAATSGAEGLAAMKPLRLLQLARAWLLTSDARDRRAARRAGKLVTELRRASNELDPPLKARLTALEQRVAELPGTPRARPGKARPGKARKTSRSA